MWGWVTTGMSGWLPWGYQQWTANGGSHTGGW